MTLSARRLLSPPTLARAALVLGTLAALGYFAWELVVIAFRLGPRIGTRSALGIALPLIGSGYALAAPRTHAQSRLPVAVSLAGACLAGALALAAIPRFLALLPFPVAELCIASCAAWLAVAAQRALDASHPGSSRALARFAGVAAAMLGYVLLFGIPQVVPGGLCSSGRFSSASATSAARSAARRSGSKPPTSAQSWNSAPSAPWTSAASASGA